MLPEIEQFPLVIVSGLHDSGPVHWQTSWESQHPDSRRFAPKSFEFLELDDWVRAVGRAVASCASPPLVVAHSGGCLATLEWASRVGLPGRVTAVLLVAPPDPSGPLFEEVAPSFRRVKPTPLGVPSALVASTDDPWASFDYAAAVAEGSGAELHNVGNLGHINADSGLGDWPEGQRILAGLVSPSPG